MAIKKIRIIEDANALKAGDDVAVLFVEDAVGGDTGVEYDGLERINIKAVSISDVYSIITCWLHSLEFVFGGETLLVYSSCRSVSSSDVAVISHVLLPRSIVENDTLVPDSPLSTYLEFSIKSKMREVSHV